jgi:hypothetical protein
MAELIKQNILGGESKPSSHVSSMTGGCTYPIYQRVVNVENGSVII